MMKKMIRNLAKPFCVVMLLLSYSALALAQLSPVKSQFFQNPYLINPSMAGYNGQTSIFASYTNQWNRIEGAPVLMALSASTALTDKAALGVNVISDKSGLMKRTQAMGSFAYKLKFSEDHNIRFGISLSWSNDRLDRSGATTSGTVDPALQNYNNKENYLDGNFGLAYNIGKLQAQFSYLNLNGKRLKELSTVDYSTFYSAVSYEFDVDAGFKIKPLVAYRGVNGHDNLWDAGAEWKFNQLMLYSMYHSNGSLSGGFGFLYQKSLLLSGVYGSMPRGLDNNLGGQFDVTVGYTF